MDKIRAMITGIQGYLGLRLDQIKNLKLVETNDEWIFSRWIRERRILKEKIRKFVMELQL